MPCFASIACYPAKIPHFFESLKILAFCAILLRTPLIACESFMEALLSGFRGLCVAWHYPPIDGLNGLRPTLRVGAHLILEPRERDSCPLEPLSVGSFASLSAEKYATR